jgi:L-alanine-DL-glutamate epimerase-like enolase superfamily enzyme
VILTLEEGGVMGRGEAAPTDYYEQNATNVAEALERVRVQDPWDVEGTLRENNFLPPSALAALDSALHDLAARTLGVPVYRLLGLTRPKPTSAYTLSIADRETTLREAEKLSGFPILKMKVGGGEDLATVRAVAEASEAALWVDANEAFPQDKAPGVARELKEMGAVRLIEQPVPASAGPGALHEVTEAAEPVPIVADESAVDARDVPRLAGIAAATQISSLADFVDLDGAMLLAEDPFSGLVYEKGRILLSERPGLGVEPL